MTRRQQRARGVVRQGTPLNLVAMITIDVPRHGVVFRIQPRNFYGEPSKGWHEAIESANAAALIYLQNADIVFVDDANLQELTKCKRSLLQATFWAEAFEVRCISQRAEISVLSDSPIKELDVIGDTVLSDDISDEMCPTPPDDTVVAEVMYERMIS